MKNISGSSKVENGTLIMVSSEDIENMVCFLFRKSGLFFVFIFLTELFRKYIENVFIISIEENFNIINVKNDFNVPVQ